MPKRQSEYLVELAAQDFAAFYDPRPCTTPQEAQCTGSELVINMDGKDVPRQHANLRTGTRQVATVLLPLAAIGGSQ